MKKIILLTGLNFSLVTSILVLNSPVVAQSPIQTNKIKGTRAVIVEGKIESILGKALTISKDGNTYTVNTDGRTILRRKFWGKGEFSQMQAGHTVSMYGKWTDEAQRTIYATLVRDLSIQKRNGVFFGTVMSVSDNAIVINMDRRGTQTVTVSSATRFFNRKEKRITLKEIAQGHRIRVKGLWDSVNNTVTDVAQIKDFSLPVTPTVKK